MPEKWKPHIGQRRGVKHLLEQAVAALFADPGVGKTSIVYAAFLFLQKRGLAKRMLVVAPLRPAQLVWPAEQHKWSDFAGLKVAVLHGKRKNEALYSDADVCVINPEGLDWLLDAKQVTGRSGRKQVVVDVQAFKKLGFDVLAIDELTMAKSTNSGRHKALKAIRDSFSRIWGLTGTPAPNGLIDLFGQLLVLDGGRSFGPWVTHFRREYFLPSYDGTSYILKKDAEKAIYKRLRPVVLRLAASDYIDMPGLVENKIEFDMPPAAMKFYNKLEDQLIAEFGNHVITAPNAAAAGIKLQQVASGGVYLNDVPDTGNAKTVRTHGRPWALLHNEKTDLLVDLVSELQGTPLLVAYNFHHDLERIQGTFGKNVPNIGSGTSERRAREIERAWNLGDIPVMCGHPQSIGHGLNLQFSGNHVCWYTMPWAYDLYEQLNGRIRRQGSRHNTVFVHHLIGRGTIDETIFYALKNKARVQDALLLALREKVRARSRK